MNKMIRDHIISLLEKDMREDRRKLLDYRKPITLEYGVSSKSAEGSARVRIGETEVVAGVKLDVGEPFPDTPDDGILIIGAELLPLSNPEFESGPPSIDSIELARIIDRGIREGNTIDLKKLCIKEGEKVWAIFLDIYPINDNGNLFDAAALAALAALRDTRFPEYDAKKGKVNYEKRTSKGLPLKKLPIMVTVSKIKNKFIVDPDINEWKSVDARLSVTTTEDGLICAMQKGCEMQLSLDDIEKMIDIATEKGKFLREFLK